MEIRSTLANLSKVIKTSTLFSVMGHCFPKCCDLQRQVNIQKQQLQSLWLEKARQGAAQQ